MRAVTRAQMREIDRRAIHEYGIPAPALMENAGRALAAEVRGRRVLVVCGRGNNGGDGYVAARHLANRGCAVALLEEGEPQGEAAAMAFSARLLCRETAEGGPFECVVDALYGTGLNRPPEGRGAELIRRINAAGATVVAADVPSGLDADTGLPLGEAVRAAVTVTMGLPKVGFARAAAYVGRVVVADIGLPRALLESPPAAGTMAPA
jgi:NAD(P)H-hydrate epimerase